MLVTLNKWKTWGKKGLVWFSEQVSSEDRALSCPICQTIPLHGPHPPYYSLPWDSGHLSHTFHSSKCLTVRKFTPTSRNPARVIRPPSLLNWTMFWDRVIQTHVLCTAERHVRIVQHGVCPMALAIQQGRGTDCPPHGSRLWNRYTHEGVWIHLTGWTITLTVRTKKYFCQIF